MESLPFHSTLHFEGRGVCCSFRSSTVEGESRRKPEELLRLENGLIDQPPEGKRPPHHPAEVRAHFSKGQPKPRPHHFPEVLPSFSGHQLSNPTPYLRKGLRPAHLSKSEQAKMNAPVGQGRSFRLFWGACPGLTS